MNGERNTMGQLVKSLTKDSRENWKSMMSLKDAIWSIYNDCQCGISNIEDRKALGVLESVSKKCEAILEISPGDDL